jgi:ABC-type polysaccharide/polyol phosphate export permease
VRPEYDKAIEDIVTGASLWRMWGRIGWQEVRRRYRRTVIGPFWTTLSLAIFVISMGLVWSQLWGQPVAEYLPFLTVGVITWTFISVLIGDGCTAFNSHEGLIKQMQVKFTLLVIAGIWRNAIVFFHNLAIFVGVVVALSVPLHWGMLLAIPGLALLCLNGVWIGLLCGMACTRYRDLQPLIGSVLQVAIFVTPVFYNPAQLGVHRFAFATLNPLFHLIDVVRAPLLGTPPALESWLISLGLLIVGGAGTLYLFARFRRRVAFWL